MLNPSCGLSLWRRWSALARRPPWRPRAFSSEVSSASHEENASRQKTGARSDSIRTDRALGDLVNAAFEIGEGLQRLRIGKWQQLHEDDAADVLARIDPE